MVYGLCRGGIIQIQVSFFPSNTFMELKLTGMQGDVMKESMNARGMEFNTKRSSRKVDKIL